MMHLRPLRLLLLVPTLTVLVGCRDSSVAAYRIPKEKSAPRPAAMAPAPAGGPGGGAMPGNMAGSDLARAEGAGLAWTAPAHWKTKTGSSVRKGSFAIEGDGGTAADLAITAFPGDVGGDLANVNRWRSQLDLAPIAAADLGALVSAVENQAVKISLVELTNAGQRMLAAFVPFNGATWFFKLTGPTDLVAREKDAFVTFLQTVRPADDAVHAAHAAAASAPASPAAAALPAPTPAAAPMADMANTAVIKAEGPSLKWTAPAHWEARPISAMRKGSYTVHGAGDHNADLSITAFPGDVGGELANVNRWRNQLGLAPISAAELPGAATRLEVNGLHLTIVDLAGTSPDAPQRMIGAIVPYEGATWFFKLIGPDTLVTAEKPAFLSFLHTLQTP